MNPECKIGEDQVEILPTDLWAKIFLLLRPACEFVDSINDLREPHGVHVTFTEAVEQQAQFHMLKLVCRQFSRVLQEHLSLSNFLLLDRQDVKSFRVLPTLKSWLRSHSSSISCLAASCQHPIVEVCLGALSCASAPLFTVALISPRFGTLQALSACSAIHSCCLCGTDGDELDLAPLTNLSHLRNLWLDSGVFSGLLPCPGTTCLKVTNSSVTEFHWNYATSHLQRLMVFESDLYDFVLSSCPFLTELTPHPMRYHWRRV